MFGKVKIKWTVNEQYFFFQNDFESIQIDTNFNLTISHFIFIGAS